MKFTGQVRVPEVDHPGVPATFVVEDDQAEVLLDGESLGRWSLFDVHASRLVSAAFSVSLAGDEITFIADEPVDFAYKGVDHMAESWARYKAMTLPRRMVAVGRSRRGTRPSRVAELRDAMLANLENQSIADWEEEVAEQEVAARSVPAAPLSPPPPPPPLLTPEPPSVEVVAPPVTEDEVTIETPSRPMRPGPGLVARARAEDPAPVIPEIDPVDVFQPEPAPTDVVEAEPVSVDPVEGVGTEAIEELVPESLTAAEPEPEPEPAPVIPEPEPVPLIPELISELLETPDKDAPEEPPKRLVVDLDAYEARPAPTPTPIPTKPRVPALAVTAPAPDRSGIFGAVRAAFVRSKGSHEHEFVEAPGGIGIIRHICSECGYISIGVSESESE